MLAYGKRDLMTSTPLSGAIWNCVSYLGAAGKFRHTAENSSIGTRRWRGNETICLAIAILYNIGCANSLSLPGDEQKSRIALRNRLVVELYERAKE